MKVAIIDIGSNSVRLMLWADGKTLYKKVTTTRLGENLSESGKISTAASERTVTAIQSFCEDAKREGARVYAFATAAVRNAQNGDSFCKRVKEACGINLDVVSGKEEAVLGISGALGKEDGGIIDIGGASTEVSFRRGGSVYFSVSMNIGAVCLYNRCKDEKEKIAEEVRKVILPLQGVQPVEKVYAIGGTASTLAAVKTELKEYNGERLHHLPLSFDWVKHISDKLLSLTTEERLKIVGMDPSRADVIAGAAYLLAEIMKTLSVKTVYFSDCDNLEGYLIHRGLV